MRNIKKNFGDTENFNIASNIFLRDLTEAMHMDAKDMLGYEKYDWDDKLGKFIEKRGESKLIKTREEVIKDLWRKYNNYSSLTYDRVLEAEEKGRISEENDLQSQIEGTTIVESEKTHSFYKDLITKDINQGLSDVKAKRARESLSKVESFKSLIEGLYPHFKISIDAKTGNLVVAREIQDTSKEDVAETAELEGLSDIAKNTSVTDTWYDKGAGVNAEKRASEVVKDFMLTTRRLSLDGTKLEQVNPGKAFQLLLSVLHGMNDGILEGASHESVLANNISYLDEYLNKLQKKYATNSLDYRDTKAVIDKIKSLYYIVYGHINVSEYEEESGKSREKTFREKLQYKDKDGKVTGVQRFKLEYVGDNFNGNYVIKDLGEVRINEDGTTTVIAEPSIIELPSIGSTNYRGLKIPPFTLTNVVKTFYNVVSKSPNYKDVTESDLTDYVNAFEAADILNSLFTVGNSLRLKYPETVAFETIWAEGEDGSFPRYEYYNSPITQFDESWKDSKDIEVILSGAVDNWILDKELFGDKTSLYEKIKDNTKMDLTASQYNRILEDLGFTGDYKDVTNKMSSTEKDKHKERNSTSKDNEARALRDIFFNAIKVANFQERLSEEMEDDFKGDRMTDAELAEFSKAKGELERVVRKLQTTRGARIALFVKKNSSYKGSDGNQRWFFELHSALTSTMDRIMDPTKTRNLPTHYFSRRQKAANPFLRSGSRKQQRKQFYNSEVIRVVDYEATASKENNEFKKVIQYNEETTAQRNNRNLVANFWNEIIKGNKEDAKGEKTQERFYIQQTYTPSNSPTLTSYEVKLLQRNEYRHAFATAITQHFEAVKEAEDIIKRAKDGDPTALPKMYHYRLVNNATPVSYIFDKIFFKDGKRTEAYDFLLNLTKSDKFRDSDGGMTYDFENGFHKFVSAEYENITGKRFNDLKTILNGNKSQAEITQFFKIIDEMQNALDEFYDNEEFSEFMNARTPIPTKYTQYLGQKSLDIVRSGKGVIEFTYMVKDGKGYKETKREIDTKDIDKYSESLVYLHQDVLSNPYYSNLFKNNPSEFNAKQKEIYEILMKPIHHPFFINTFFNSNFLNQLSAGFNFEYKDGYDQVKRMSINDGEGSTGRVDNKTGLKHKFNVAIFEDVFREIRESSFFELFEGLKGKLNNLSDGQSMIHPLRQRNIMIGFGRSFNVGSTIKNLYSGFDSNGDKVNLKTSSIVLSDTMIRRDPSRKMLRRFMETQMIPEKSPDAEKYPNDTIIIGNKVYSFSGTNTDIKGPDGRPIPKLKTRMEQLFDEVYSWDSQLENSVYYEYLNILDWLFDNNFIVDEIAFESALKTGAPVTMFSFDKNGKPIIKFNRGLSEADKKGLSVNGFAPPILKLDNADYRIQLNPRHSENQNTLVQISTQLISQLSNNPKNFKVANEIYNLLAEVINEGLDLTASELFDKSDLNISEKDLRSFLSKAADSLAMVEGQESLAESLVQLLENPIGALNLGVVQNKLSQVLISEFEKNTVRAKAPGGGYVLQTSAYMENPPEIVFQFQIAKGGNKTLGELGFTKDMFKVKKQSTKTEAIKELFREEFEKEYDSIFGEVNNKDIEEDADYIDKRDVYVNNKIKDLKDSDIKAKRLEINSLNDKKTHNDKDFSWIKLKDLRTNVLNEKGVIHLKELTRKGVTKINSYYAEIHVPRGYIERLDKKYTHDKNGRWLSDAKILENMRKHGLDKLMGYRIPATELHSSVPLRISGFSESMSHDNIIVVPAEIVLLHGSDFDIDKLYIMDPLVPREDIELPYFDSVTGKREFVQIKKGVAIEDQVIHGKPDGISNLEYLLGNFYNRFKKEYNLDINASLQGKRYSKKQRKAMLQFFQNLRHFKIQQKFIDTISNEDNLDYMMHPTSLDSINNKNDPKSTLNRIKNEILSVNPQAERVLRGSKRIDLNISSDSDKMAYDNNIASDGTGIAAAASRGVSNLMNAVRNPLSEKGVTGEEVPEFKSFNYIYLDTGTETDSKKYLKTGYSRSISKEGAIAGETMFMKLDQVINGFIDHVKEQIFNRLNIPKSVLNEFLASTVLGIDDFDTTVFLNQPIIEEYKKMFGKRNLKNEIYNMYLDIFLEKLKTYPKAKDSFLEKIENETDYKLKKSIINNEINRIYKEIRDVNKTDVEGETTLQEQRKLLSTESLKMKIGHTIEELSLEDIMQQLLVFKQFLKLNAIGDSITQAGKIATTGNRIESNVDKVIDSYNNYNNFRDKIRLGSSIFTNVDFNRSAHIKAAHDMQTKLLNLMSTIFIKYNNVMINFSLNEFKRAFKDLYGENLEEVVEFSEENENDENVSTSNTIEQEQVDQSLKNTDAIKENNELMATILEETKGKEEIKKYTDEEKEAIAKSVIEKLRKSKDSFIIDEEEITYRIGRALDKGIEISPEQEVTDLFTGINNSGIESRRALMVATKSSEAFLRSLLPLIRFESSFVRVNANTRDEGAKELDLTSEGGSTEGQTITEIKEVKNSSGNKKTLLDVKEEEKGKILKDIEKTGRTLKEVQKTGFKNWISKFFFDGFSEKLSYMKSDGTESTIDLKIISIKEAKSLFSKQFPALEKIAPGFKTETIFFGEGSAMNAMERLKFKEDFEKLSDVPIYDLGEVDPQTKEKILYTRQQIAEKFNLQIPRFNHLVANLAKYSILVERMKFSSQKLGKDLPGFLLNEIAGQYSDALNRLKYKGKKIVEINKKALKEGEEIDLSTLVIKAALSVAIENGISGSSVFKHAVKQPGSNKLVKGPEFISSEEYTIVPVNYLPEISEGQPLPYLGNNAADKTWYYDAKIDWGLDSKGDFVKPKTYVQYGKSVMFLVGSAIENKEGGKQYSFYRSLGNAGENVLNFTSELSLHRVVPLWIILDPTIPFISTSETKQLNEDTVEITLPKDVFEKLVKKDKENKDLKLKNGDIISVFLKGDVIRESTEPFKIIEIDESQTKTLEGTHKFNYYLKKIEAKAKREVKVVKLKLQKLDKTSKYLETVQKERESKTIINKPNWSAMPINTDFVPFAVRDKVVLRDGENSFSKDDFLAHSYGRKMLSKKITESELKNNPKKLFVVPFDINYFDTNLTILGKPAAEAIANYNAYLIRYSEEVNKIKKVEKDKKVIDQKSKEIKEELLSQTEFKDIQPEIYLEQNKKFRAEFYNEILEMSKTNPNLILLPVRNIQNTRLVSSENVELFRNDLKRIKGYIIDQLLPSNGEASKFDTVEFPRDFAVRFEDVNNVHPTALQNTLSEFMKEFGVKNSGEVNLSNKKMILFNKEGRFIIENLDVQLRNRLLSSENVDILKELNSDKNDVNFKKRIFECF